MDYDLYKLGWREFEHLMQSVFLALLGPGLQVFGDGPDGGREATFEGTYPLPSWAPFEEWNGYGVLQVKFHQVRESKDRNAKWLIGELTKELNLWMDPRRNRVRYGRYPEYLLVATNVELSPVPRGGGLDMVNRKILEYVPKLGLKGWDLWHYDKIRSLIDNCEGVGERFSHLTTPGEVLHSLKWRLEQRDLDEYEFPSEPGRNDDGEAPRPVYGTVEEFVTERFVPMYRRLWGEEFRWCSRWWLHAEAISRLTALWYAWEVMRLEPGTGIAVWYRDFLDPVLPILMGPNGPFAACDEHKHNEIPQARLIAAPEGYWSDP